MDKYVILVIVLIVIIIYKLCEKVKEHMVTIIDTVDGNTNIVNTPNYWIGNWFNPTTPFIWNNPTRYYNWFYPYYSYYDNYFGSNGLFFTYPYIRYY